MYVNALITLQENLSTYGIDGKRVTGHVTITSPGLVKCYVQNLKKQVSGQTYALYAFSKAKDKGIRLGNLGSDKETKWIIDGKNIENSGMNLEELDGIAIVVEDDMRGVDTILMGFKNNRYMIIPLIDEIFKKRVKPVKSGGYGSSSAKTEKSVTPSPKAGCTESTLSKPSKLPPKPVEPGNSLSKPAKPEYSPPRNEKKIGVIVKPDSLQEGPGPVVIPPAGMQNQEGPGPVVIPPAGMQNQEGPGPVVIPPAGMQNQEGPGPVVIPPAGMQNQEGPGPVVIPPAGMQNQEEPGPVVIPPAGMQNQEGPGPVVIPPAGMQNQEGPGPVIIPPAGMQNQGGAGPVIIPQTGMQNQGGPGPVIIPPAGMQNQGGSGPVIIPQTGMQNQEGPGPVIIPPAGMQNQGGLGPDIILQTEMQNSGEAEVTSCPIEKGVSPNLKVENQDNISEKQDFIKVKVLDKKVDEQTQGERMESVDLDLLKIAEKLKQIGKQSSEEQNVKTDTAIAYNNVSETSKLREDAKEGQDEVSKELQRIINMLKENQEIKQKTKGIEEQIERMRKLPQTHKLAQKTDLEKTLESRYMAQQLTEEEKEEELEAESCDTSPKNALHFMLFEKPEDLVEKIVDKYDDIQRENVKKQENMDSQDEIDYIHEIDKKIKEIEAKRKQQEGKK